MDVFRRIGNAEIGDLDDGLARREVSDREGLRQCHPFAAEKTAAFEQNGGPFGNRDECLDQ